MRIIDLLDKRSIRLDGMASDKKDALDKMVELMAAGGKINDVDKYREGFTRGKRRVRRESGMASRSRTANPTR